MRCFSDKFGRGFSMKNSNLHCEKQKDSSFHLINALVGTSVSLRSRRNDHRKKRMEWSAASATKAYFDTIKLCEHQRRRSDSWKRRELGSTEFLSALAAGMRAKLIVEVTPRVSPSTIALATAARHTGGRLVCILPEPVLPESKRVVKDMGFKDTIEFKTGDPSELLPSYQNIDFSLVDCKNDEYTPLLKLLDVNPRRSMVVANNLVGQKKGLEGHVREKKEKIAVRSIKYPIGTGMEVTMISGTNEIEKQKRSPSQASCMKKRTTESKWVVNVDENGEEHIFRVINSTSAIKQKQ